MDLGLALTDAVDGPALCLNTGSSSVKVALLLPDPGDGRAGGQRRIAEAAIEGVGTGGQRAWARGPGETRPRGQALAEGQAGAALSAIESALEMAAGWLPAPSLIVHRVVHGGLLHRGAARIDGALLDSLAALTPLAPLHQPAALAGMRAALRRWPALPQVACFDTAFHASLPEVAWRLPLPGALLGDEVRRYGFHGLSFGHVMWTLGAPSPSRVVIAHLGSGASVVAVKDGLAVDTTMGFTPTGGVPMGTRTGDLDPGVLFYLARQRGLPLSQLEGICEHESGLLAVGGTADMRSLIAAQADDPRAALAIQMFGYAVRKTIGAYAAVLGGLDVLVFTGGIGAHTPLVRREACRGLEEAGVVLDGARNDRDDDHLNADAGRVAVRVIPADEESQMAREARALLR